MRMRFREIKECKYEQAERNVVNTTYADSERPGTQNEEIQRMFDSLFEDDYYTDSERPQEIEQPMW